MPEPAITPRRWVNLALFSLILAIGAVGGAGASAAAPAPLVRADAAPVDWWFAFKFNARTAPDAGPPQACAFGGTPHTYRASSQAYAVATATAPQLTAGAGPIGVGPDDPLGATFAEVYNGTYHYVVWNDQFYQDPKIAGCADSCSGPWGHSKGVLAWDDEGQGLVIQVSTPDWPGAGGQAHPRPHDGNTLGCVNDNNVLVSQHFFALRLNHADVVKVLQGLANASVVTNPHDPQLVANGGPDDIATLVETLGTRSTGQAVLDTTLSSGVRLIVKPSKLYVPPWQMVSAILGGVPLRTATWWTAPAIPATRAATPIGCWSPALGAPGDVDIAVTGTWQGQPIGLKGGAIATGNHAKVGVSTAPDHPYAIFGDMNQQGTLSGNCKSSQNGRGGLFYVLQDPRLAASVGALIAGTSP